MQNKLVEKPGAAVTFSVRLWEAQRELLLAAAAAKHKTLPDWMLWRLMPIAAEDAGVPLPEFPEFPRRPYNGRADEEKAAKKMGMTRKQLLDQFEQMKSDWLDKINRGEPETPRKKR